jgi:aminopeptidase N
MNGMTPEEVALGEAYPSSAEGQRLAEARKVSVPVPAEVAAIREADPARRMFKASVNRTKAIPDDFLDHELRPQEEKRALIGELREMVADLGLSDADVGAMRNRSHAYKGENAPTEESQRRTAWQALTRKFGEDGASRALTDAKALIARDRRVTKFVESMSLGNDPETIIHFAEQARRERLAGRLK